MAQERAIMSRLEINASNAVGRRHEGEGFSGKLCLFVVCVSAEWVWSNCYTHYIRCIWVDYYGYHPKGTSMFPMKIVDQMVVKRKGNPFIS